MIRITRVVSKDRLTDLLNLKFVSRIELKQRKQTLNNPDVCSVNIYLATKPAHYFKFQMEKIVKWGKENKSDIAENIAITALKDGFIKEGSFKRIDFPMPIKYKKMCNRYSDEFFKSFNKREI